jgi:hypothetical protein
MTASTQNRQRWRASAARSRFRCRTRGVARRGQPSVAAPSPKRKRERDHRPEMKRVVGLLGRWRVLASGSGCERQRCGGRQRHRSAPEGVTGRARILWARSAMRSPPGPVERGSAKGQRSAVDALRRLGWRCGSGAGAVGRCCQAWMTFRMGWMVGGWSSTPRSSRIGTNPCGPHVSRASWDSQMSSTSISPFVSIATCSTRPGGAP